MYIRREHTLEDRQSLTSPNSWLMYTISCRSQDREEVLAPQNSSASVLAHTFEAPSNLRLLAPAMQRKHNSFLPKATGNMYLASPRPWGINSRGGERSFTRRCNVRGGEGGLL